MALLDARAPPCCDNAMITNVLQYAWRHPETYASLSRPRVTNLTLPV